MTIPSLTVSTPAPTQAPKGTASAGLQAAAPAPDGKAVSPDAPIPSPVDMAIAAARQSAAARQDGLAVLMANLLRASAAGSLPAPLLEAIDQLISMHLPTDVAPDAAAVKTAVATSGLFTEAKLASDSIPKDIKTALLQVNKATEDWLRTAPPTTAQSKPAATNTAVPERAARPATPAGTATPDKPQAGAPATQAPAQPLRSYPAASPQRTTQPAGTPPTTPAAVPAAAPKPAMAVPAELVAHDAPVAAAKAATAVPFFEGKPMFDAGRPDIPKELKPFLPLLIKAAEAFIARTAPDPTADQQQPAPASTTARPAPANPAPAPAPAPAPGGKAEDGKAMPTQSLRVAATDPGDATKSAPTVVSRSLAPPQPGLERPAISAASQPASTLARPVPAQVPLQSAPGEAVVQPAPLALPSSPAAPDKAPPSKAEVQVLLTLLNKAMENSAGRVPPNSSAVQDEDTALPNLSTRTATDPAALMTALSSVMVQAAPSSNTTPQQLSSDLRSLLALVRNLAGSEPQVPAERPQGPSVPPPVPGTPGKGQPAAVATLPEHADAATIAKLLVKGSDAALARHTLLQIASLPDAAPPSRGPDARWIMDIPLMTAQGSTVAQLVVERDSSGATAEAPKPVWRVQFALDIEPLGPVRANLALSGDHAWVTLAADRPESLDKLRSEVSWLADALQSNTLEADIAFQTGVPEKLTGRGRRLVDHAS